MSRFGRFCLFVLTSLLCSDHYTPQGINSVSGLRFENVTRPNIVGIRNCGPIDCPQDGVVVTHSSRIYSVWDFDGTLAYALTGSNNGPAIVGSNQAWWKGGDDCAKVSDAGCCVSLRLSNASVGS